MCPRLVCCFGDKSEGWHRTAVFQDAGESQTVVISANCSPLPSIKPAITQAYIWPQAYSREVVISSQFIVLDVNVEFFFCMNIVLPMPTWNFSCSSIAHSFTSIRSFCNYSQSAPTLLSWITLPPASFLTSPSSISRSFGNILNSRYSQLSLWSDHWWLPFPVRTVYSHLLVLIFY